MCENFPSQMNKEFEMSTISRFAYFLEFNVNQLMKKIYAFLSQSNYTIELIKSLDWKDVKVLILS